MRHGGNIIGIKGTTSAARVPRSPTPSGDESGGKLDRKLLEKRNAMGDSTGGSDVLPDFAVAALLCLAHAAHAAEPPALTLFENVRIFDGKSDSSART